MVVPHRLPPAALPPCCIEILPDKEATISLHDNYVQSHSMAIYCDGSAINGQVGTVSVITQKEGTPCTLRYHLGNTSNRTMSKLRQ